MASGSKKAVLMAIVGNAVVTVLKFGAAMLTHSASMMNEAVHSFMDTTNQLFLLIGLKAGERPADEIHAFGHGQKKYLWNLWSAIGLFSIGAGLGLSHAWHSYKELGEHSYQETLSVSLLGYSVDPLWVSGVVLLIALVVEAWVLYVAAKEFLSRMKADNETGFWKYLKKTDDPTLLAVLLEDSVAVFGVILAATGIGLARLTGNPIWDIGFSAVIALILAVVAVLLGAINMRFLTDISDKEAEQAFCDIVLTHPQVERWHDLRSVIIDESHTVLVAEIELREEIILTGLARRVDEIYEEFLQRVPNHRRDDDAVIKYLLLRSTVQATLERTEQVIDEIEKSVKQRCPQVFHLTLEVEGIAETKKLESV